MPTLRRIAKRQREELTKVQRCHLLTGWCVGGMVNGRRHGFQTREEFLAAWEEHRDELMQEFIAKAPGQRPFAWWLARGIERPLSEAGREMFSQVGDQIRANHRLTEFFGFLHQDEWQEDETQHLRRNALLLPGEEHAIAEMENRSCQ